MAPILDLCLRREDDGEQYVEAPNTTFYAGLDTILKASQHGDNACPLNCVDIHGNGLDSELPLASDWYLCNSTSPLSPDSDDMLAILEAHLWSIASTANCSSNWSVTCQGQSSAVNVQCGIQAVLIAYNANSGEPLPPSRWSRCSGTIRSLDRHVYRWKLVILYSGDTM